MIEIVTSATSAFKEYIEYNDDDDDNDLQVNDDSMIGSGLNEDNRRNPIKLNKIAISNNMKYVNDHENNTSKQEQDQQQQDEWEDFESSTSQYEQLRLKFSRGNYNNKDDDFNDDEYYDDDNNNNPNDNNDNRDITGDRGKPRDKPVWNIDQIKQQNEMIVSNIETKVEETPLPEKSITKSTGVYRPPQLRGGTSIPIISGINQRTPKAKEPNLSSIDEFPTLGSTVSKK